MNDMQEAILKVLSRGKGGESFGRTKLMKNLYFLKEIAHVNVASEFELYTWGPFSKNVLDEKDVLIARGLIKEIEPTEDGKGYDLKLVEEFNSSISSEEENVLSKLKGLKSAELEALSTIHFVHCDLHASKDTTLRIVKNLKPYFAMNDLNKYYQMLMDWNWIS